jgi:hypothetical protein
LKALYASEGKLTAPPPSGRDAGDLGKELEQAQAAEARRRRQ